MATRSKRSKPTDNAPPSKKAKTSRGKISVWWEWLGDGGIWEKYSDDSSALITKRLASGAKNVKIKEASINLEIVFERMVQKNASSGFERDVCCQCDESSKKTDLVWQWQDQYDEWQDYDVAIQRLLNACVRCGCDSIKFKAHGRTYEANLTTLTQINTITKVKRTMRNSQDGSPSGPPSIPTTKADSLTTRSLSVTGTVPVDPECSARNKYHIYKEGQDVYDAMLNQTNLKNNNNKFYLMQLLESNAGKNFAVWFRWGRVGLVGQSNLVHCNSDLEEAKEVFTKKFHDKTRNDWNERLCFEKVEGKYDVVLIDYSQTKSSKANDDAVDGQSDDLKKNNKLPKSDLDARIQFVIDLICNVEAMKEAIIEMKYDAKKAPLGKLTSEQITNGYKSLKKIEKCVEQNQFGDKLIKACDQFYTMIPHCFGMCRPPVLRTTAEIQQKINLLEALEDIEIALKVIDRNKDVLNPIDRHYQSLNCALDPLDHAHDDFKMVTKYVQNTHAKTHNDYKMTVQEVFTCQRNGVQFEDVGNRMLLWHGSRLGNYVGILSQGLRIAPPEAPVTGYMFGKGVYFADMSSKSANYCYASQSKNVAFVLLCEVALGKSRELLDADPNASKLPQGFHSIKGLGKSAPNPADNLVMGDGTIVPLGKPKSTGVKNPKGYTLNYNEYIVYDTKQIKPRYLVQLKFHFDY